MRTLMLSLSISGSIGYIYRGIFLKRAVETIRVAFSQTVAARAGCGGATQRMGTVRMDGASRDRFKIRTSAFASERAWGTGHGETAAPPI
jgi:hypothetical protein